MAAATDLYYNGVRNYGLRAWSKGSTFDTAQITLSPSFSSWIYTSQKINLTGYSKITITGTFRSSGTWVLYIGDNLYDCQDDSSLSINTSGYEKLAETAISHSEDTLTFSFSIAATKYIAVNGNSQNNTGRKITQIKLS